ncbi:MAG: sensor histidine kinase [Chloroflexota bacterium]|jgi:signal transduction histidine kinase
MPNRDLAAKRLLAVTEEELQRIVLDIHDGPVQNLFAALSQLTLLRSRISAIQPPADDCIAVVNRTINLLESSLGDIRDLLGTFRSAEFATRGLAEIVEDIVIQHESFNSGRVTLEMDGALLQPVSMPVKIALCRILQESLSNVRRHAGVENASVKLWVEKENLVLEVADQGRGFEPPPLSGPHATERQEHIGLRGMRERAALVGGKLFVESQPGAGTCVRVEVPLHE